jgi:hypothetical protein
MGAYVDRDAERRLRSRGHMLLRPRSDGSGSFALMTAIGLVAGLASAPLLATGEAWAADFQEAPRAAQAPPDLPPPPPPPPGVEPAPPRPAPSPAPAQPAPPSTAEPPPPGTTPQLPDLLPPLPPPPPPPPGAKVEPPPATTTPPPGAPNEQSPKATPPPPRANAARPKAPSARSVEPDRAPNGELEAPKKERWYGWQILLGLAGSHILFFTGIASGEVALIGIGIGGHLFAGPITHWGHGSAGRGFGALGINVGVPLGAGLLGTAIGAIDGDGYGLLIGAGIGGFVGIIAAPIIDIAALAYEPVELEDHKKYGAKPRPGRVSVAPILGPTHNGLHLSVEF